MKQNFYIGLAIFLLLILGVLSLIPFIRRKLLNYFNPIAETNDTIEEDYETVIAKLNEAHEIAEDDDHYYVDVRGELHREFAHPI